MSLWSRLFMLTNLYSVTFVSQMLHWLLCDIDFLSSLFSLNNSLPNTLPSLKLLLLKDFAFKGEIPSNSTGTNPIISQPGHFQDTIKVTLNITLYPHMPLTFLTYARIPSVHTIAVTSVPGCYRNISSSQLIKNPFCMQLANTHV